MTREEITDLKQFISSAVLQGTEDIRQDISGFKHDISGLKQDFTGLKQDISALMQDLAAFKQQTNQRFDELHLTINTYMDAIGKEQLDFKRQLARVASQR